MNSTPVAMTTSDVVLNVNTTTMATPLTSTLENKTYTLGPPDTIWGLEVELFSYIFLAIGGVAPVVFIVIVVISMRCYTWRKLRRFQRYEARYRTGMVLWESEKKYQMKEGGDSKGRHAYDGPGQVISDEESGPSGSSDPAHPRSPTEDYRGLKASMNNPNVYFREVSASVSSSQTQNGPSSSSSLGRKRDSEGQRRVANGSVSSGAGPIDSEEQRALDCFDQILELSEGDVGLHESKNSKRSSQLSSSGKIPSPPQGQGVPQVSRQLPRRTLSGPPERSPAYGGVTVGGGGGSLPGTPSRRGKPVVQITAQKPPETTESLELRDSWLHSSFVNVAYATESEKITWRQPAVFIPG